MSGKLIYVVGASGSGKDTLLKNTRRYVCKKTWPVIFAHRYITRPVELVGENHIALTDEEFGLRLDMGLFAMHWESHGLKYGLGIEVEHWLKSGHIVIMNGSRNYLPKAMERVPDILPVQVETTIDELRKRLLERGRESEEAIEKRLVRAREEHLNMPGMRKIDSSGTEQNTLNQFIEILNELLLSKKKKLMPVHFVRHNK